MTVDVFFSYDSNDGLLVGRLKDGIENRSDRDIDIYIYEEDRKLGQPIAQKAKNRIRQSDLLIVLITPNSRDSMWVHQEIGYAEGVDCPVVPIVHDEVDAVEIRGLLSGVEYLGFDPDAPDEFFREFLGYIEETFDSGPPLEHKRRGDSLRADAEDHLEAGNFDRGIETLERAHQAYESARDSTDEHDTDTDEIQQLIDEVEEDLRSARRLRTSKQLDSLRSRIDHVEELVDENAFEEARDELEALRPRLATIEGQVVEHGFDDLHEEVTSLNQRYDELIEEPSDGWNIIAKIGKPWKIIAGSDPWSRAVVWGVVFAIVVEFVRFSFLAHSGFIGLGDIVVLFIPLAIIGFVLSAVGLFLYNSIVA